MPTVEPGPTPRAPVAWVLNLDAEDELAGRGAHTPSASMIARIEALRPKLAPLLAPGDLVVWPDGQVPEGAAHLTGRAWCPTRWALGTLARAKVAPPQAPAHEVLRRVNHRRFAHTLGATLPGSVWVTSEAELAEALSARTALAGTSVEGAWLLKRPFGFAGRGRQKVLARGLGAAERAWVAASLRSGDGLLVEPWVERVLDCALHGWLDAEGRCTFGQPTLQDIDATGAWTGTTLAAPGALTGEELRALEGEARRAAEALHAAGYFGAFGLDAYRWRTPSGALRFQPRSEVNARYSMGWAIGLGGFRPPAGAP